MNDQTPAASFDPRSANILVTGGAGFIGSNFIRYVLELPEFRGTLVNFDKLTYAGNLMSLSDIGEKYGGKNYVFERGDIRDQSHVETLMEKYQVNCIVHFAAE